MYIKLSKVATETMDPKIHASLVILPNNICDVKHMQSTPQTIYTKGVYFNNSTNILSSQRARFEFNSTVLLVCE